MPETCVFWQRGGNDVDRRGNNNENTIKSRLHRLWQKEMWRKYCKGAAHKIKTIHVLKLSYLRWFN